MVGTWGAHLQLSNQFPFSKLQTFNACPIPETPPPSFFLSSPFALLRASNAPLFVFTVCHQQRASLCQLQQKWSLLLSKQFTLWIFKVSFYTALHFRASLYISKLQPKRQEQPHTSSSHIFDSHRLVPPCPDTYVSQTICATSNKYSKPTHAAHLPISIRESRWCFSLFSFSGNYPVFLAYWKCN